MFICFVFLFVFIFTPTCIGYLTTSVCVCVCVLHRIHQSLIIGGCFSFSRSKVKVMTFGVSKWFWSRKNVQIRFNLCSHVANITKNIVWKFRTPRSKVKFTSEIKVTPKIKSAGNFMERVENWKSHFQNYHTYLTFW